MSTPPRLTIFNSSQRSATEVEFSLFPRLPKELRLKIWRHSLQRSRSIKITLLRHDLERLGYAGTSRSLKAGEYDYHYTIVDGCKVLSKLFCVSSESREAALSFYRVQIPCRLNHFRSVTGCMSYDIDESKPGTFYFNPEYDFLQIYAMEPVAETMVDFLYHLKTIYDPLHVGLLNLALGINELNANDLYALEVSTLKPHVRNAFLDTIAHLEEVWFVVTEHAGRTVNGLQSGLLTRDVFFNRSYPIHAHSPAFDRIPRDPRAITQDLKKIFTGTSDPRDMVRLWHSFIENWGLELPRIQYRFRLSFSPTGHQLIHDHEGAKRWLRNEDDLWHKMTSNVNSSVLQDDSIHWQTTASDEISQQNLENAIKPAFGFWLFDIDAIGPMLEKGVPVNQGYISTPKRLVDMSKHWPELALQDLY